MFERRFKNREEAGKRLAKELLAYRGKATIVFAIPRGGVVTAYEIAKVLDAPLDIIIPRKIGAPGNKELAVGAVTEDGTTILNTRLVTMLGISDAYIASEKAKQIETQAKLAGRKLIGSLTKLPKIDWNKEVDKLNLDKELGKEVKLKLNQYLAKMN